MRDSIVELSEEATRIRRELHKIPEKGFHETKTSDYIYNYLLNINIPEVHRIVKTGIIAYIPGKSDSTIAFRADMDGLAVDEKTQANYKSKHQGMMHACGHDGHMTILLLFAKHIMENKITPHYSILLIFQPAEEGPGGAKLIIEEGVLEKYSVKKIYGCHIMPSLQEGKIGCRPNEMMAQNGEFYIDITGQGAHAASQQKGVDSIMIASHLISALNTVVSRNVDALKTALLSIGIAKGGTAVNVIADKFSIAGTMRALDEDVFQLLKDRISDICSGYENAFNCEIDHKIIEMYPPVVNDKKMYYDFKDIVEKEIFEEVPPMMISEDFSFYQKEVPGLLFYLGSKNEERGFVYDLHHNKFDFNEDILLMAVEIYTRIVERQQA